MRIRAALAGCLIATTVAAQPQPGSSVTPAMRSAANEALEKRDWKTAATRYEAIVVAEPKNYIAGGRLGRALLEQGRAREALPHLAAALEHAPSPDAALQLARAHAQLGEVDRAFAALETLVKLGGIPQATLAGERDFAKLPAARMKQLASKNEIAVEPCRGKPEYRQFDFWIGDWIVTTPQGNRAGTSSVQLMLGTCVLQENWTGGGGGSGKSFNIYDATDKQWHQSWVDDKGTFAHYIGGFASGAMQITADQAFEGKPARARMTFSKLPGGSVRQHGERSTDQGKTWTTTFDLVYKRK
ncbi:MAG: tetratricopeptide repeat protein [Kofleriaceae bacterium]